MRSLLIVMVLALTIVAPIEVLAQTMTSAEVNRHTAQGEVLFEAGNYEGALAEFESAYEGLEGSTDRHLLLYNIGQCYQNTLRYDRALRYYQRYLDEGGAAAEGRADVEATMRALEGLLATLAITVHATSGDDVAVPEVEVWVDGLHVTSLRTGESPEVRVTAGLHNVEVRSPGYERAAQEVQTPARQRNELVFELRRLSDYEGIDAGVFWVTGATALAVAVAGGACGAYAYVTADQALRRDPGLFQSAQDYALAADVLFGVAGATAIATLVLGFMTDWDGAAQRTEQALLLPWVSSDGAGFLMTVTR